MTIRNYTTVTITSGERATLEAIRDSIYDGVFIHAAENTEEESAAVKLVDAIDEFLMIAGVFEDESKLEGDGSFYRQRIPEVQR